MTRTKTVETPATAARILRRAGLRVPVGYSPPTLRAVYFERLELVARARRAGEYLLTLERLRSARAAHAHAEELDETLPGACAMRGHAWRPLIGGPHGPGRELTAHVCDRCGAYEPPAGLCADRWAAAAADGGAA